MNRNAESLYTHVFRSLTRQWERIKTIRRLAVLGLPSAQEQISKANRELAHDLVEGAEFDEFFKDNAAFLEFTGGKEEIARKITEDEVATFNATRDAAPLVFAHSALDAAVSDLLEVASIVAPADWDTWIDNVPLAKLKQNSVGTVRRELVATHLEQLKKGIANEARGSPIRANKARAGP